MNADVLATSFVYLEFVFELHDVYEVVKVGVAETVVSMENASVKTLNAGDFVDLFGGRGGGDGVAKKKAARSVVEELERNWEEVYGGQYDANELGAETFQRSVAKEERGHVNH